MTGVLSKKAMFLVEGADLTRFADADRNNQIMRHHSCLH